MFFYFSSLSTAPNEKVWAEVLFGFFIDNKIYDFDLIEKIFNYYGFKFWYEPKNNSGISNSLISRVDEYIKKYFKDTSWVEEAMQNGWKFSITGSLEDKLGEPPEDLSRAEKIIRVLKDKIGMAGNYFSDYLFKLIKQKNLSEIEVYKRAHLDRRIFSKIRNEKNYMPSKKTILAIAIAMKLDFKETNTLLKRAGYFLGSGRKEDIIIAYFIENQIYDLFLINEVLDYYECPTLGD